MIFVKLYDKSFSVIRLNEFSTEIDNKSKTVLKRLLRVAEDTGDEVLNVPRILVAQIGKNYSNNNNDYIKGQKLLVFEFCKRSSKVYWWRGLFS